VNQLHFQTQIQRLVRTFGQQAYTDERIGLIWREVSGLHDQAWTYIVDQLIGDHRHAPMLPEIRELASIARAKAWEREKKQHANDAKAFFKSSFAGEDLQTLCQLVIERVKGNVKDQDWSAQMKAFQHAVTPEIQFCRACEGDGLIFHKDEAGYEWAYRCHCHEGSKQPSRYAVWRRA
jgi:hypothetical protein